METLRVGDPLDKSTDIGAIVAPVQLQRIRELVAKGEAEGATLWQPKTQIPAAGCFFPPSLFTEVEPASTIAEVEIFGPVAVSMTFRTPSEAVELANNTRYGLAASIWSENLNRALEVAAKVKAGVVWINCTNLFDAASGFGGYRESGFGREGGREGLAEYLVHRTEKNVARRQRRTCLRAVGVARCPLQCVEQRAAASTAPPRCTSAASKRGPTAATATRCMTRRLRRPGGPGQSQRHAQCGRGCSEGQRLGCRHRTQSRTGAVLRGRESCIPRI